jgi:two-component system sensor histidine kinase DesK
LNAPRPEAQNRREHAADARDHAFVTRHAVRVVATLAVAIALMLCVSDVWTLAFDSAWWWARATRSDVCLIVLCTTLTFALHVRHVYYYAVRGERPPAAAWTLSALAVAIAFGVWLGGSVWIRELALLAVSILLIVPIRWALPGVAIVVLTPLIVVDTEWYAVTGQLPGVYFVFAVVWRTVTQFVPLRLLAVLRALDAATQELEARACVSARARIETEVRRRIGPTLRQIVVRGEASRAAVEANPRRALAELHQLVGESRRGLAEARRVAASYRSSSLRAALDAATALLEASGARVQLLVEEGLSLDGADAVHQQASHSLRTAVAAALRHEPHASYRIHITRDDSGLVRLRMTPDGPLTGGVQEHR